jgi:UDP-glucose:glycoprotein glucosyltransferase
MDDGEMSFTVGDEETALVEVAMIIDPITEMAQKWSALAKVS